MIQSTESAKNDSNWNIFAQKYVSHFLSYTYCNVCFSVRIFSIKTEIDKILYILPFHGSYFIYIISLSLKFQADHSTFTFTAFCIFSVQTENSSDIGEDYADLTENPVNIFIDKLTSGSSDTALDWEIYSSTSMAQGLTIPDDPSKLSCTSLTEYGSWTFTYKYTQDQIKALMCRCHGICKGITVPQDVKDYVHKDLYDPLSERNRPEFIAVITVFLLLFFLGTIGQ